MSGKLPASDMISLGMPEVLHSPLLCHQAMMTLRISSSLGPSKRAIISSASPMMGTMASRTTALNSSSLLAKYRYRVPFDTPARLATSSSRVDAKPRSTNKSRAAASNSWGRASLRRSQRGLGSNEHCMNTPADQCVNMTGNENRLINAGSLIVGGRDRDRQGGRACHWQG